MPLWLINLIPMIWRFFKHWGIYILITLVIVGGPYLLYRKGHNDGYKSRVCPPTYVVGPGGTVINNTETFHYAGIQFKLFFIDFKVGK